MRGEWHQMINYTTWGQFVLCSTLQTGCISFALVNSSTAHVRLMMCVVFALCVLVHARFVAFLSFTNQRTISWL